MCCNWLVGRGKYHEAGEEGCMFRHPGAGREDVFHVSQVAAGKSLEYLSVDGVKFSLKKAK